MDNIKTVIMVIRVAGMMMSFLNIIPILLAMFGIREMHIWSLKFVVDKFFVGVILANLPILIKNLGMIVNKDKVLTTNMETILCMSIVVVACLAIFVQDICNCKKLDKKTDGKEK